MLVTVEGIHGCGKTTLVSELAERIRATGADVIVVLDQRATPIGREIFHINFENPGYEVRPLTEALLVAAARHQDIVEVIKPHLAMGKIVLCERFVDAFYAFHGSARGLPLPFLECVGNAVAAGVEPDLTFLLDVDPRTALSRIAFSPRHRNECEPVQFHSRVREGYLARAKIFPKRFVTLDASVEIGTLCSEAWRVLQKTLLQDSPV